jgi:hypothetical protein
MVITSPDIKLPYLFKRAAPPVYGLVLRCMNWALDRILTRKGPSFRA